MSHNVESENKEKLQADLRAAYIEQNNDSEFWAEFKLWDVTVGDGIEGQPSFTLEKLLGEYPSDRETEFDWGDRVGAEEV